jgi:putative Holliday junction resolvase
MGRILSIDYGTKKIGLAVSDESKLIVSSLPQIPNNSELTEVFSEILQKYDPELIILGFPTTDYDELTNFQKQIVEFKNRLQKISNVEIIFRDESYSSEDAEEIYLQKMGKSKTSIKKIKDKKKQIDSLAAHLLLKSYLDSDS